MQFDTKRGQYSFSLFSMTVMYFGRIEKLSELPVQVQSTFFHEYFHFVQDATTPFAYNVMWNTYAGVTAAVQFMQQTKTAVRLPLTYEDKFASLLRNRQYLAAVFGDKGPCFNEAVDVSRLSVVDAALVVHPDFADLLINDRMRFVKIGLQDENGAFGYYWFGGFAIAETMTYLIQQKFFGPKDAPDYPYRAAMKLAEHVSPRIGANEEHVFALCDIALQSPFPGWAFIELLQNIEEYQIDIQDAEQLYEYGLAVLDQHWNIAANFERYREKIHRNIDELYGHVAFEKNKLWFKTVLDAGYEVRTKHPTFMLDWYRQSDPFAGVMTELYIRLGTPEVLNADHERGFMPPQSLKGMIDEIHPLFLSAFQQLHDVLLHGEKSCSLHERCKASTQKMPLDQHCHKAPWMKVTQQPLCPFTAVWKAFGLEQVKLLP